MADEVFKDEQAINAQLTAISERILPTGLRFRYLPIDSLVEQDLNPRSMPVPMFEQLVANIRRTGGLESIPLCADVDGVVQIVSGHHRTRAARAAGQTHAVVLAYDGLTRASIIAKQLAHNTISGTDDLEMVKRLFGAIDEIPAQFEAFVDPKVVAELPQPVKFTPVDIDLQEAMKSVLLLFLPVQLSQIDTLIERVLPAGHADRIYLAQREHFDAWIAALRKVRQECEIVAVPTAVAEMARLATQAIADGAGAGLSQDQEGETWVPVVGLLGTTRIPAAAAAIVRQAMDKMLAAGDVTEKAQWQALERWAADYLAGP